MSPYESWGVVWPLDAQAGTHKDHEQTAIPAFLKHARLLTSECKRRKDLERSSSIQSRALSRWPGLLPGSGAP